MVWIECVWGGMVTDASVFVLLKRTNQAWTKRERERNPGIQRRVHSKMSRWLSFAGFGVISLLKLLPYFGNSSGPKSLIIYRQLVHPPPQQYVYFSTFHLRPSILSFKLCPQNQSCFYFYFWMLWPHHNMHPISYSHSWDFAADIFGCSWLQILWKLGNRSFKN